MSWHNCRLETVNTDPDEYHKLHAEPRGRPGHVMSRGEVIKFAASPSKWRKSESIHDQESDATRFGSLVDCLALTPHQFSSRFAVKPLTYQDAKTGEVKPWNGNSNVCKQWLEDHKDKVVISASEWENAKAAHEALLADQRIGELWARADFQVMVLGDWHDRATSLVVPCKALIDIVPSKDGPHRKILADLKTCRNGAPVAWPRQVWQGGYHVQAAWYLDMFTAATGQDRNTWLHVLVENIPPFEVGRRLVSSDFCEIGRGFYQQALADYCQCLAANRWPGWDDGGELDGWTITAPEAWMLMADKGLKIEAATAKPQTENEDIIP